MHKYNIGTRVAANPNDTCSHPETNFNARVALRVSDNKTFIDKKNNKYITYE